MNEQEVQELKEENERLRLQLERHSNFQKEKIIKVEKITPPEDYEKNKSDLIAALKENHKLKKIISSGKINNLDQLIRDYKIFSALNIDKIVQEFLLCRDSEEERHTYNEFLHYIEDTSNTLKKMLYIN